MTQVLVALSLIISAVTMATRGEEAMKNLYFDRDSVIKSLQKHGPYQVWNDNMCQKVVTLFQLTGQAIRNIESQIRAKNTTGISERLQLDLRAMKLLSEELVDSEKWIFSALYILRETIKNTNNINIGKLVGNTKVRLQDLQYAMMKEEQKLEAFEGLAAQLRVLAEHNRTYEDESNVLSSYIEILLEEVGGAADELELSLHNEPGAPIARDNLETVKKLVRGEGYSSRLEDVHGNTYVISQPADRTIPVSDPTLLHTLLLTLLFSGLLGAVCHWLWIPSIFGYIISGVVLGPSFMNVVINPVQIETLGELGVFLILFCCGLEFSPMSLTKVWRVSVGGSCCILLLMIITFTCFGVLFNIPISHCVFVATCLSFSSTTLIIRFLQDDTNDDVRNLRDSILGLLVTQDIQLSIFIGFLPMVRHVTTEPIVPHIQDHHRSWSEVTVNLNLGVLVVALAGVSGVVYAVLRFGKRLHVAGLFNRTLSPEMRALLPLSGCCTVICVLYKVGVSMEVSSFFAGVLIRSVKHRMEVERYVEPVRDVFSVVFFTGVGMHVYPYFVWKEFLLILMLTVFVVAVKYLVCLLVLHPLTSALQRTVISAGLAQISEFSFVLASRGRHLHFLTREVYLLILSITATSLILSPLIWKVSLMSTTKRRQDKLSL